jgi:hypothetical protein
VPVEAGCPSMSSLPAPAVPLNAKQFSMQTSVSADDTVTVDAKGIPAGDILVVALETTSNGNTTTSLGDARLVATTAPAPSCVSLPAPPPPPALPGSGVSKTASGGSGSA